MPQTADSQAKLGGGPAVIAEAPHPVNSTGLLYPYSIDDQIGYIDQRGTVIVEPLFDEGGDQLSHGRVEVAADGRWGYLDDQGKLSIPLLYKGAQRFSEGLAAVQLPNGLWGYIDPAGKTILEARYKDAGSFHEGLAFVSLDVAEAPKEHGIAAGGTFGYIDKAGQMVIAPRFASAHDFHDGRAGVRIGARWGFIDAKGNVVVQPKYESVSRYSEQRAMVVPAPEQFGFIDMAGRMIIGPRVGTANDFSEGAAPIRLEGKQPLGTAHPGERGYLDLAGGFHKTCGHCEGEPFSEGLALVCDTENSGCGYIDHTYQDVFETRFQYAFTFYKGLARAGNGYDDGYIDRHGTYVYRYVRKLKRHGTSGASGL